MRAIWEKWIIYDKLHVAICMIFKLREHTITWLKCKVKKKSNQCRSIRIVVSEVLELLYQQKKNEFYRCDSLCHTGSDLSRPTEPAIACVWYWYHAFQQAAFWFCTFWRQPCVQSARVFGARTIERLMNDLVLALASCTTLVDTSRSGSNTSTSNVTLYISMQRYFLLKELNFGLGRGYPSIFYL